MVNSDAPTAFLCLSLIGVERGTWVERGLQEGGQQAASLTAKVKDLQCQKASIELSGKIWFGFGFLLGFVLWLCDSKVSFF